MTLQLHVKFSTQYTEYKYKIFVILHLIRVMISEKCPYSVLFWSVLFFYICRLDFIQLSFRPCSERSYEILLLSQW